jgi:hypothetical protein
MNRYDIPKTPRASHNLPGEKWGFGGLITTNVLPITHDHVVDGVVVPLERGIHVHREEFGVNEDLAIMPFTAWAALVTVARTQPPAAFEAVASATWENWAALPAPVRIDLRTWVIAKG